MAINARELLIEQFFLPFFVTYLRDMKQESFTVMASPELAAVLAEMKVGVTAFGHYEMWKLSKEQYIKFRYHFIENRMNNQLWIDNKNEKAMQLLLNAFALVFCKKVPSEIGVK